MGPTDGSSSKRRSLLDEQDVNRSTFRRRNKIIAVVFTLLIISLTLLITTLVIKLRPRIPNKPAGTPPLLEFCSVTDTPPTCLTTFNPVIAGKSITDPNQIFALSLQTAAADLQHIINTSSTDTQDPAFNNCSNSLRDGLGRVRESLATMRVNPFVGWLSEEQRDEMKKRIEAAEEDVESCLDDLAEEMTAKLVNVQVYLSSAVDFVAGHGRMGRISYTVELEDNDFYRRLISGNLILFGLQLLFVFGLFCSLFRTR